MSDGALRVLDGTQLRDLSISSLPEHQHDVALTGAQLLDLADSKASSALFGLSLPHTLKSSALSRIFIHDHDVVSFLSTQLNQHQASLKLQQYLTAIADQLKDDPLVISISNGNIIRVFLEDEDDFAMLAENLFTDLDTEDKGKISKSEIRNALIHMGVEMGVPPFSEFPLLNDLIKKHRAEGEEELGQAQFAELLQPVLQELAETLAEKPVVFIQNIKVINGSKLRKLLADEKELNYVVEKILKEKHSGKDGLGSTELIRDFLERNGKELGLPPSEANIAVVLLYDTVFADVKGGKCAVDGEKDEFGKLVKEILDKVAEQLEANPIFVDLDR